MGVTERSSAGGAARLVACAPAAPNVIVNTLSGEVNFIDVEDMYGPGLPSVGDWPNGTEGYHDRTSKNQDHRPLHAACRR